MQSVSKYLSAVPRSNLLKLFLIVGLLLSLTPLAAYAGDDPAQETAGAEVDQSGTEVVLEPYNPAEGRIIEQTVIGNQVNTVVEIIVQKDAFIASNFPNNNFGLVQNMNIGYNVGNFGAVRPIFRFSMGAIPVGAHINSAQLQVYQYALTPNPDPNGDMAFQAQYMRADWGETTVTWNNASYLGGGALPIGSVNNTVGWKYFDATTPVREWRGGQVQNHGLIVTGDERPDRNRMRNFYTLQSSFQPRLIVDYTVQCDTLPPVATMSGLAQYSPAQFSTAWSGYDVAPAGCAPSGLHRYDVEYRLNGGGWVAWINRVTSTSAIFNSAGNGTLVEFRARADDNAGNMQVYGNAQASTIVDTVPPVSAVNPLGQFTPYTEFTITWSGSDNLSGVAYYDVQYRVNDGPWQYLIQNTQTTAHTISGAVTGQTYYFRARAVDRVGNAQAWTDQAQAQTIVFANPLSLIIPFNPAVIKPTAPVTTTIPVAWLAFTAPGSNITKVDLYFNYNGQGWTLWKSVTDPLVTSDNFPWQTLGLGDGFYQFYSIATNSYGQMEPWNLEGEANVIVDMADAVQPRANVPVIAR